METATQSMIYTIGHSNLTIARYLELLTANSVKLVVDVRSTPYSRFAAQFNRESLKYDLARAGIAYSFAGELLGGRPSDPSCYYSGRVLPPDADFLAEVNYPEVQTRDWFKHGIELLMEQASSVRLAVMCSEEDPATCHRHHLLATYLVENEVAVYHIRKSGETQSAGDMIARAKMMPVQARMAM